MGASLRVVDLAGFAVDLFDGEVTRHVGEISDTDGGEDQWTRTAMTTIVMMIVMIRTIDQYPPQLTAKRYLHYYRRSLVETSNQQLKSFCPLTRSLR